MAGPWQTRTRSVATEVMRTYEVPGMIIAVAGSDAPPEHLVLGTDGAGRPLTEASLVPVASITKLATALAILRLVDAGRLAVDDEIATHLPDAAAARPGVTVHALLTHTSGLPFAPGEARATYAAPTQGPPTAAPTAPPQDRTWPAQAQACLATPPAEPAGARVAYSNTGYGLLAVIVERLTGQQFPAALRSLVLEPLGIEAYLGGEPPRPPAIIADVRGPLAGTPWEPYNTPAWRTIGEPWGGLITTAAGALALVRAFRGVPTGFLHPVTCAAATRNQVGDLGGGVIGALEWPACPWGLGPMIHGGKTPNFAPAEGSPESFGHTGLSGGVAWADPVADVAWAILGTRTTVSLWGRPAQPILGAAILGLAR